MTTQSASAEVGVRRVGDDATLAKLLSRLESLEQKVDQAMTTVAAKPLETLIFRDIF